MVCSLQTEFGWEFAERAKESKHSILINECRVVGVCVDGV